MYFNTNGKFGVNGNGYTPFTTTGLNNCAPLIAEWGNCAGQYGYATIVDFATVLTQPAIDNNHALFAQDAWTIGHGLTLNLGIRVEKESLPVPQGVIPAGLRDLRLPARAGWDEHRVLDLGYHHDIRQFPSLPQWRYDDPS